MNIQKQLELLEDAIYNGSLGEDINESLYVFNEWDDYLTSIVLSYSQSDDIDFRKASVLIILASNHYEKKLFYPLFRVVMEWEQDDIRELYYLYVKNNTPEFIDFLYQSLFYIQPEEIEFFIKVISIVNTKESNALLFYTLEHLSLNDSQVRTLYKTLIGNESGIKTVKDFYFKSQKWSELKDGLKTDRFLSINYSDLEKKESFLRKKISQPGRVSYFYNSDEDSFQIWVNTPQDKKTLLNDISGISVNFILPFPNHIALYFLFQTEDNSYQIAINLDLNNSYDSNFLSYLATEGNLRFIFVDGLEIESYVDFIFAEEIIPKFYNQLYIAKYFLDYEWLRIERNLPLVEKGELVVFEIPVSPVRKAYKDISLFNNICSFLEKSSYVESYLFRFQPIFYKEEDFQFFGSEDNLERNLRDYITLIDAKYPFFILFIYNGQHDAVKYMSYLLPENVTETVLREEVIKRLIFSAQYLDSRGIVYYEYVIKIAKYFNIELTEQFMNRLAEHFENNLNN
ncbi:hypothetical protein JXR93_13050 [bacterium]|nr:hypothetical protein [bacterium]